MFKFIAKKLWPFLKPVVLDLIATKLGESEVYTDAQLSDLRRRVESR